MSQKHSHPVLRQQKPKRPEEPRKIVEVIPGHIPVQPKPPAAVELPREEVASAPRPQPKVARRKRAREPFDHSEITVVVVNFKTRHLTQKALQSLLSVYPGLKVILVDNGSRDKSTTFVKNQGRKENITVILNEENRKHGPAMNQAIMIAETRFILLWDSDCVLKKKGLLEAMTEKFKDKSVYATGWKRWVNFAGVPANAPPRGGDDLHGYIHPHCALIDRKKFLELRPFQKAGAPCTQNMRDAISKGWKLLDFKVSNYIHHHIAGTRRMFRGRWNPSSSEKPLNWKKNANYPI